MATAKLDPMDPDDRKVLGADGKWSVRAYNAYERGQIEQGKLMVAKANWERRHGYENC